MMVTRHSTPANPFYTHTREKSYSTAAFDIQLLNSSNRSSTRKHARKATQRQHSIISYSTAAIEVLHTHTREKLLNGSIRYSATQRQQSKFYTHTREKSYSTAASDIQQLNGSYRTLIKCATQRQLKTNSHATVNIGGARWKECEAVVYP